MLLLVVLTLLKIFIAKLIISRSTFSTARLTELSSIHHFHSRTIATTVIPVTSEEVFVTERNPDDTDHAGYAGVLQNY